MANNENKSTWDQIKTWWNDLSLRGLLKAILIACFALIVISLITRTPNFLNRMSSFVSTALYSIFVPSESASVTIDKNIINSSDEVVVKFKPETNAAGLFAISYNCDADVKISAIEDSKIKTVACESPFYLLDNTTTLTLKPETVNSVSRVVLQGLFENSQDNKVEAIGTLRLIIKNSESVPTTASTPVTNTNTDSTNSATAPNNAINIQPKNYLGQPDLAIRLIQIGLLNGNTIYGNQNQFSAYDNVGLQFEVRNDGDTATGPWSFTAYLPSVSTPVFNSNPQISLRPGEKIIFTLGFSGLRDQTSNLITINVDPQSLVSESSEANNYLTAYVYNSGQGYNYNNGCYINGTFTYDCYNYNYNYGNNYNYWPYNYYSNSLYVSCYASPNDPETGDRVRWSANVSGGTGNYDYEWEGTNGLDSSSSNPTKTYSSTGNKRATVTVTDSADREATASCSVYVD